MKGTLVSPSNQLYGLFFDPTNLYSIRGISEETKPTNVGITQPT